MPKSVARSVNKIPVLVFTQMLDDRNPDKELNDCYNANFEIEDISPCKKFNYNEVNFLAGI